MDDSLASTEERALHWRAAYERNHIDSVSWHQAEPVVSLELIDLLGIEETAGVIDVGGGASVLVDALCRRRFTDLTVLDICGVALQASRKRVGTAAPVTWIANDLMTSEPERGYDLWHDRAVFHVLAGDDVGVYLDLVDRSVVPGGSVIMATFAPDGPERCSGLPVARHSADQPGAALGSGFEVVETRREVHTAPAGALQPFTWIAARRGRT